MTRSRSVVAAAVVGLALTGAASAEVGIQGGLRGGLELDGDLFAGGELRLAFASSPLTLALAFDNFFIADETLFQISVTPLYELPIASRFVRPYAGAGLSVIRFEIPQEPGPVPAGFDNNGQRVGISLAAGVRFDLRPLRPYVHAAATIGEIKVFTLGVGVLFGTTRPARVAAAPPPRLQGTLYIANNVLGDVQSGRGGLGASIAYFVRPWIGVELDAERHDHFFRDEDVADLVPAQGVDLNTDALLFFGHAMVPMRIPGAESWRPYGLAGAGLVRAVFDARGADQYDRDQLDVALSAGAGVMHALSRHVGLRAELRYAHAFADESTTAGGYFKNYGWWRASFGVTVGGF
jgi:opacity protein-like surface antigen